MSCNPRALWFSKSDHTLLIRDQCVKYSLAISFMLYNYEGHSTFGSACSCLSNSFAHLKSFKLLICVTVGLEKLFAFVLDHRNWMLELLFLEGAVICVSDKMYHVVMATEILMYWLMTLTLFDGFVNSIIWCCSLLWNILMNFSFYYYLVQYG